MDSSNDSEVINNQNEKELPCAEEFSQYVNNRHAECQKKVQDLAQGINAEFAFLTLILDLTIFYENRPDNDLDLSSSLIELAAFHLYPRFGKDGSRDKALLEEFNESLKALNAIRGLRAHREANADTYELSNIQSALLGMEEIVRGNGYPFQTEKYITEVQGPFESWFKKKLGIGPKRSLSIINLYEKIVRKSFEDFRTQFLQDKTLSLDVLVECLFPSYTQIAKLITDLTPEEWEAFKQLIGLTPAIYAGIEKPRDMKNYPLYCLSRDRIAVFNLALTYDALFERFDCVARGDEFYDKKYQPKRAKWLEKEVYNYCCRIFRPENVYKNLTYPDPDKERSERELDITVFWEPFLIFFETKGSQFRPKSKIGSLSHLRDDLKDSVEEAFEQTLTAVRFIESRDTVTFVEKRSNRKLEVKKNNLLKIFPVNVTLHRFSHLTTQLGKLKPLGLFKTASYPWSVSIADLDVITKFAGAPDVFIHYIQRRLELQRIKIMIIADELDLFAYYLDDRLDPYVLGEGKDEDGRPINMMALIGNTQRFDDWFGSEITEKEKPVIKLNLPPKLSELLQELRRRDDVSARWISFTLLSLSPAAIDCIENHLETIKEKTRPNQRFPTLRFKDRDTAVILSSSMGMTTAEMENHGRARLVLEKYQMQALNAISIGIDIRNASRPFEYAFWFEHPWEFDQQLEDVLKIPNNPWSEFPMQ